MLKIKSVEYFRDPETRKNCVNMIIQDGRYTRTVRVSRRDANLLIRTFAHVWPLRFAEESR